ALDHLLKERSGDLGELFGVTRQVAGDAATTLAQSMISAEFPDREEFLRGVAAARDLPSSRELERVWFEMQREMTETGRVAHLSLPVVEPGGASHPAEVVRVGPFVATAGGRYLTYLPGQRAFAVLPRQPPAAFTRAAVALETA